MQHEMRPPIHIRPVTVADLPRMFEWQLDPESNDMAVTKPRTAEAFDKHWAAALQAPQVHANIILRDAEPVGMISCFLHDGTMNIGYWIAREHWGQGIASAAMELQLQTVPTRPLHARVATSNKASLRVLQKHGFVIEHVQLSPADDRYPECEEAFLVLR